MIRKSFFYHAFCLQVTFALLACSANDDIDTQSNAGEQTWKVEVYATKAGGDVSETRAMFFGGNSGTNYFCLWDSGDKAEVYYGDTKVGTFTPNSYGFSNSFLTGTLTGTYAVGNPIKMYVPQADMDFTTQNGSLGDMSNNRTYMEATTSITQVDAEGKFLAMSGANFTHRQCFFRFRFSDTDGIRLHVKKLTIHAEHGKLVQTKSRTGETTYGDIEVNTVKEQNAYPDELFVALWNDYRDGNDTYSFTVEADNGYIYESNSDATRMIRIDNVGAFTRVHRALPMKSAATRLDSQVGSAIESHADGGGDSNGSVNF